MPQSTLSSSTDSSSIESSPSPKRPPTRVSGWWRILTVVLALVLLMGGASAWSMYEQFKAQLQYAQAQLQKVAQIKYIAVLLDAKQQPAVLITHDPQEFTLQLQRLNAVAEGQEDSMQLWALTPGARPRSLGVLSNKVKMQRINASDKDLAAVTHLAISVENKGGVDPSQGPRLPYLFEGAVVQKSR